MKYLFIPIGDLTDRGFMFIFGWILYSIRYISYIIWNFEIPKKFYFIYDIDGRFWELDRIYKTPTSYWKRDKRHRYNK